MKKRTKAAAAVSIALVLACGAFAGCDLITTDASRDMQQIIAEVDISSSADFAKDGEFDGFQSAVGKAEISKRDLIASFIANYSSFSSYVQSGSATMKSIFDTLSNSLVERQIYLQYAKAYLLKYGAWKEESAERETFSLSEYEKLLQQEYKSDVERDVVLLGFFLTQEERDRTDYNLRVMFNDAIDDAEEEFIDKSDDKTEYESDVRTLPTGVGTENSDYYDTAYRIYTGAGDNATNYGSYERLKNSTVTSRRQAYDKFLSNLRRNNLLLAGENTNDIETLSYFQIERKSAYEDALVRKLSDTFTAEAVAKITEEWCNEQFANALRNQTDNFKNNPSALKTALDGVSDTSFVLTSPDNLNYGFVYNILLPFSAKQEEELADADQDYADGKGNKFETRARLLSNVTATDLRGSWFTGETDHSFTAQSELNAYTGGNANRTLLFFEDELQGENGKYERINNYLGKYTYNGTYDEENRVYEPNVIKIDDFIAEMQGYLNHVLGAGSASGEKTESYGKNYYNANGTVNYESFLYFKGKVNFDKFNANEIFKSGSRENLAMSAINELLFAYNTDPGGFNKYLGYAVVADKTDFVSEFEYAAQLAVKGGAGTYTVAPSDYGWHIMYCTFSYVDCVEGTASPYKFEFSQRYEEGTFSNLYFESLKPEAVNTDATNRRTKIISSFKDCSTVYEERYSDWSNIG